MWLRNKSNHNHKQPQLLTNSSFPFARSYDTDVSRRARVSRSLGATCQPGALKTGFGRVFWQCASLCTSGTWLLLNISMSQSILFTSQQCFRPLWNRKCVLIMIQSVLTAAGGWCLCILKQNASYSMLFHLAGNTSLKENKECSEDTLYV